MDTATTIVVTILGSAGLFTFFQWLITRWDGKHDKIADLTEEIKGVKTQVESNEQSCLRVELLFLMERSSNEGEVLRVAQRYFAELHGNFYMDAVFQHWLVEHDLERPYWYRGEDEK